MVFGILINDTEARAFRLETDVVVRFLPPKIDLGFVRGRVFEAMRASRELDVGQAWEHGPAFAGNPHAIKPADWTDALAEAKLKDVEAKVSDDPFRELEAAARNFQFAEFPDVTKGGAPKDTVANARFLLSKVPVTIEHDTFRQRYTVQGSCLGRYSGELSDETVLSLRHICKDYFSHEPSASAIQDAVHQIAMQNNFNPVTDYLAEAQKGWDRENRIDTWLIDYMGAEDTPLNKMMGRLVLIAGVRRARHPGCKFDQILVLESPEGFNKSSALAALAGSPAYFSDQAIFGVSQKEQQELLAGIWIYEAADLGGLRKAEVDAATCEKSSSALRAVLAPIRPHVDRTAEGRDAKGAHVVEGHSRTGVRFGHAVA
jgi:hypothetical protein